MKTLAFVVTDPAGMHTRPASIISRKAGEFDSDINIKYGEKKMNMKSIIGIMSLGIKSQSQVEIVCEGSDEDLACQEIKKCLIDNNMIDPE